MIGLNVRAHSFFKKASVFVFLLIVAACSSITTKEVEGLWSLQSLRVDGDLRTVPQVYIDFDDESSLAISRRNGDFLGFYKLGSKSITFKSEDQLWFNSKWQMAILQGELWLRGKDIPYRTTELRFERVEQIPSFEELEAQLIGTWELYKMRNGKGPEILEQTRFKLDSNGHYSITSEGLIVEKGRAVIDTRHQKMIFLEDETSWDVWFYGKELRLESKSRGVQYSLRK